MSALTEIRTPGGGGERRKDGRKEGGGGGKKGLHGGKKGPEHRHRVVALHIYGSGG